MLSIYRGYLEGHKFITPPSVSQVIEQLARIFVIIAGSFLAIKVFNLSLTTAVGIATFGATVGALVAYLYIFSRLNKNRKELKRDEKPKEKELEISNKMIFKRIVIYSLPFIL